MTQQQEVKTISKGDPNEYHTNFPLEQIDGYLDEGSGIYLSVNGQTLDCDGEPLFVYVDSEDDREYVCLNHSIVYLEDLKFSAVIKRSQNENE